MISKDSLGVVIVNYNAGEFLLKTLDSLGESKEEIDLKIIVVDNASNDDSILVAQKKYPKVQYILNQENIGFGKANNLGIKKLKDEYILVLNPDMVIGKGVLYELINYLKLNPEVGAITPKVVLGDGTIDKTAHRGFPTPWASLLYFMGDESLYHLTRIDMNQTHEVDAITGAFLLTKRDVLDKVGLFDEDYFMYAEDIDLCYRIKKAGFKVIYYPHVSVIHYKGISSGLKKHSQDKSTASLETKKRSIDAFYKTMKIFYKKRLESSYPFFINWLVYFGINLRWTLARRKLVV